MTISTYAGNKALDLFLRGVAVTPPTSVYVSLHTADPGNNGASEVGTGAWPAYARQDADGGGAIAAGFDVAASKATQNSLQLLWDGYNGASTITITHVGIWDASSAGNFLFGGTLAASKTLSPTDEFTIKAGDLDLTVS